MQTEEEKNLEEVREEHTKRIFELYQSKSKNFRNTFSILLFFAFFFLFFILMPYVSIKDNNNDILERLDELSSHIKEHEKTIEMYEEVKNGADELKKKINDGPNHLRKFICSFETGHQPASNQTSSDPCDQSVSIQVWRDPCEDLPEEEQLNCKVQREILNQFAEYQKILENVVDDLEALDNVTVVLIDQTALEKGLRDLQNTFETELAENPDFWETVQGKEKFFIDIGTEVDRFWSNYSSIIDSQREKLEDELGALRDTKQHLEQQQTQLKMQEEQIANRLSEIEFPFGKFPIGLNESVAVFPFLLAIGFLVSAFSLVEMMRLRRAFHALYQQKDSSKTILTDEQITLVAPLWIDPADPEQNQKARLIILSIPFLIFVLACVLIFYSWIIPDPFVSIAQLNQWICIGLYVLSLTVFAYGFRQIVVELRRYSTRQHEDRNDV